MTCRTHTMAVTISHIGYIIFLSIFGALAAYSGIYALFYIHCTEDVISAVITILLAALVLSVDYFECRAMGARLYMDEEGIGVKRFKKMKVFIKWDEIQEVGTGSVQTVFGYKKRVYFCNRKLKEEEKTDLIVLKSQTVLFSYIPKDWYAVMAKHLPDYMMQNIPEKYVQR